MNGELYVIASSRPFIYSFSTALAQKRLATEVEIDVKLMFIPIIESLSLCALY